MIEPVQLLSVFAYLSPPTSVQTYTFNTLPFFFNAPIRPIYCPPYTCPLPLVLLLHPHSHPPPDRQTA